MYNFKEKKIHFNALRNSEAAFHDLSLLKEKNPAHERLETFSRDPQRYSDDILYAVLDCASREEIRSFRRKQNQKADETSGSGSNQTPIINSTNPKDKKTIVIAGDGKLLKEGKEKKKVSKKAMSTRKLTGTTSSTRKSK